MFKNYLKIAWRNISGNKSNSVINLLGLSIGIACCLLIVLWVVDELSYDQWNDKIDRTYRVAPEINFGGSHRQYANSPAPLSQALVEDFPEVESAVRFRNYGSSLVKKDVQNYQEERIIYTDSSLFDVFSIHMIRGNSKTALSQPGTVVINETTAKKYFPNDDPIGKVLTFDHDRKFSVQGVIEDLPSNSHFNFDFFVTLEGVEEARNGFWLSHNFKTYYVLREKSNVESFQAKAFPYLMDKYIKPQIEATTGTSFEDFEQSGAFIRYHHQELSEIHLHSDLFGEMAPNGNIRYVWTFGIAAIFILLIACVNFMNLTTARASIRTKEIGVRKVLGSLRTNLINQFLTESVLMTFIALIAGLALASGSLPFFNNLANKSLVMPFDNPAFWIVTLAATIMVGLLAGSYPAFYLSSFKPIKSLSGKILDKRGNLNLRNGLVVFQFLVAVVLIIGTMVIYQQIKFIQNKKLGFEREQVLIINNTDMLEDQTKTFKDQLEQLPDVKMATLTGFLPIPSNRSDSPLCKMRQLNEESCVSIQQWTVDESYIPTLGMELLSGRNFSPEMMTDSNAVIINETAARLFGMDDPVGKMVYLPFAMTNSRDMEMVEKRIIGVVKDFHFESLRNNVGALSLWLGNNYGRISLKISTDNLVSLMSDIENTWATIAPGYPFEYEFMDDSFNQVYRSEIRIGSIISIFSILSIFIACLGLFGLAAFSTERRIKEIGIRKVLGASTTGLVGMLSKDFLRLVLISMIIAMPFSWYFMSKWLDDFSYSVGLEWWIFAAAGLIAVLIAFLTVSYQSIKAAISNPIESLRSE